MVNKMKTLNKQQLTELIKAAETVEQLRQRLDENNYKLTEIDICRADYETELVVKSYENPAKETSVVIETERFYYRSREYTSYCAASIYDSSARTLEKIRMFDVIEELRPTDTQAN